jgi:hypothetical protein
MASAELSRRVEKVVGYPLCQFVEDGEECGRIADSVHHIVELKDGGAPRDPANLMSCCRSHHSVIHAQRRGGRWQNEEGSRAWGALWDLACHES